MSDCSSRVGHPLPNHPSPTHTWETGRDKERWEKNITRGIKTSSERDQQHIQPKPNNSQATSERHRNKKEKESYL